ncbi:hypothetical protein ABGV36_20965 [Escherichia coli]
MVDYISGMMDTFAVK